MELGPLTAIIERLLDHPRLVSLRFHGPSDVVWSGLARHGRPMTQRLGAASVLRVVDAILSGTHETDTSHYELLRAFADDATLCRANNALEAGAYRTHEFGDSIFIERQSRFDRSGSAPTVIEPLVVKYGLSPTKG